MKNSRRSFLKYSSAALLGAPSLSNLAAAGSSPSVLEQEGSTNAFGDGPIRLALIGCGGRGTGAASQALTTAGKGMGDVKLVAMADAFSDRLDGSLAQLTDGHAGQVDVPEDRRFTGFDAYKRAMEQDVDMVILATPPGFRPMHFEHAVSLGKHVFMEKPVAVDGPGVRKVLKAAEAAKRAGLKVGVGLQRHHQQRYLETIGRIHDGAIGELTLLRCYWNSSGVWVRPREVGQTEMTYQMRNWYYFNWLCGDHITEQHIHNLDVCNWIAGDYPVEAQGQGGRQVRTGIDHGEIFDHHMVEYTYASGLKMLSQCRHIPGSSSSVSEHAHGTRGTANIGAGRIDSKGGWSWRFREEEANPYQVEHDELFAAIRTGAAYNEAENGAKSTMTSILGRMATYSGQTVTWEDAIASQLDLSPAIYGFGAEPPVLPDADGRYPIPTPGVTRAL
ncbi:MAG: myo-inositol 2-dehydrogenase/D-chiro-inositol 1-dehydrogenase [Planctomycetota bacterium]|jgi:myo-inositol 2-dehydrogenase/D-chiro-inositol 1-dehydrogenase